MFKKNRCEKELNLTVYGCLFLFVALQLLCRNAVSASKTRWLVTGAALVAVPLIQFFFGYQLGSLARHSEMEAAKKRQGFHILRFYIYFFMIAVLQELLQSGITLRYALVRVLSAVSIPSAASVFLAGAILAFVSWMFGEKLFMIGTKWRIWIPLAILCSLVSLLRINGEQYAMIRLLLQDLVPFFGYFLIGMWFSGRPAGLEKKTAGALLLITALAIVLWKTPFHNLGKTLCAVFPIYLIFLVSQIISVFADRFRSCYFVVITAEPVFAAGSLILSAICYFQKNSGNTGLKKTIILILAVLVTVYGSMLLFSLCRRIYSWAEFRMIRVKHKTAAYFLIYSAAFCVMLLLAFAPFIALGKDLLWRTDGIPQYYPKAVYYVDYIRNLIRQFLHGNFQLPMYDFSIGMGSAVTYSMEPLYALFALFGRNHVQLAYNVITLLRFYLAGISMSVLCLYFKKEYISTFIATMVYVFCGFSLYGGARHTMFMIPMILLPVLILAIEEIIRKKQWYLCTVLVAISLLSNYYYLYMNTIAMGIYFIVRFFCQKRREDRTIKGFVQTGLVICGSYLLGVAMSCIVLTTSFGSYVSSGRSSSSLISTASLFFYNEQWIVRCFLSFLTTAASPGHWMKLGLMPISMLSVVFLFARKGRKELKILTVITGIMMLFPLSGFIFSGFDSVINRWCYIIAFLTAYIVADCLPDMRQMNRREILACAGVVSVYGFLAFFGIWMVNIYTQLAFILLLTTFVILLIAQERIHSISRAAKQCLLLLLTTAMVFYNGFSLFYMAGAAGEYTNIGRAEPKAGNTPLAAVNQIDDDGFYRVASPKLDYLTVSASLMHGYNSISQFSSTINGAITQYLEHMGSTGYSVTQMLGFNNRVFMNALADIKYYASYDNPKKTIPYGYKEISRTQANDQNVTIYENQNALPLGYTYDSVISQEELDKYPVLERQEVLMQSAMLKEADLPEWAKDDAAHEVQTTAVPLEISSSEENGIILGSNELSVKKKKGKLKLYFKAEPNSETYLVLKNAVLPDTDEAITLTFKTKGNSIEYRFRGKEDRYGTGQQDYVFNLGYHEEAIESCRITANRKGTIQFEELRLYSQPMEQLESYTKKLTEDVLENVEVTTNKVSGTITTEREKLLVLSIPYQKGWTARIDGEVVPIKRANYMYMALPLTAGEHSVELSFAIPGMKYAMIIMAFAWGIFILLCLWAWFRNVKKWVIKKKS